MAFVTNKTYHHTCYQ